METTGTFPFPEMKEGFKSYYVVWKPVCSCPRLVSAIMFKSYYVVWKRRVESSNDSSSEQFKSYYVVWKPCRVSSQKQTIDDV